MLTRKGSEQRQEGKHSSVGGAVQRLNFYYLLDCFSKSNLTHSKQINKLKFLTKTFY